MKTGRLYLIAAIGDLTASICFLLAFILHTEPHAKPLCGAAAACFLIAGVGFFFTYHKGKNTQSGL